MKLVYFGNKLSIHGRSKSVLETLEPLLGEFCDVKCYSNKRNKFFRLSDMLFHFFKEGLQADIIMIDVYSTISFYFAFILAWVSSIFNKPFILFLHGGNLPERYVSSKRKVDYIFKRARSIVAPSGYLKTFFEKNGYKVILIPNLIDLEKFGFQVRDFSTPRLLYLRGFGEIYNPLMNVRVVSELMDEYPGIQLAMLGSDIDGFLEKTYELIDCLKLGKHVKIFGKKSQEEWTHFIPCENQVRQVNELTLTNWKHRLVAERLIAKSGKILSILNDTNFHWEETFWWLIAANFGLTVNSDFFQQIAKALPVAILAKHKNRIQQIEALLFGVAGLLRSEFHEKYPLMLQKEFIFYQKKYKLKTVHGELSFLRMRPANFPTVRLSQFALIINKVPELFSNPIKFKDVAVLKKAICMEAQGYWLTHYKI